MSAVFIAVVAVRLLVPLGIPRFPLPAILAALVVDAADQTVFQHLGGLPANYQSYDKALDVYYLMVAYAATLRNWTDPTAFRIARFLWYYRLVGTVVFELTAHGWLLVVFPNTFEYFFIAYEVVRTCWDPTRLSRRALLGLAAVIWVVVKLPQEIWLHVLHLDVTEFVGARPWVLVPVGLAVLAAALVVVRLWPRVPRPDWAITVSVDSHLPHEPVQGLRVVPLTSWRFWGSVAEKVLLVGLISIVFVQALDVRATTTQVVLTVAVFVAANAVISQLFTRRGARWRTTVTQFLAMAAVNGGTVEVLTLLRGRLRADADPATTLFFVLLISLIVTLYDRYRVQRALRLADVRATGARPPGRRQAGGGWGTMA